MLAEAGYTSKDAGEAARETAQAALAGMAEYMTERPLVREGDVVWRYMRYVMQKGARNDLISTKKPRN